MQGKSVMKYKSDKSNFIKGRNGKRNMKFSETITVRSVLFCVEQDMQCAYNGILRCVRIIFAAVQK